MVVAFYKTIGEQKTYFCTRYLKPRKMDKLLRKNAFEYHALGRPGKLEVVPTKPHSTQRDLSLAYTPGVADPCMAIHENYDDIYRYTGKGNLVAVISNGTAVLGLGDIGAGAGKPVMEGKGLLFKVFADIDVFDIEVDEKDPDAFVAAVKAIAPTFGGINLEDIKAPECFEIERRLIDILDIPVMHDDQHGTAMITGAALLNALEIVGKDISKIKLFVSGAGAAACACTSMYIKLGVKPENIIMSDINGVLTKDRTDLSEENRKFATDKNIHTIAEGIKGADMFLGLSAGGVLKKEYLLTMAENPIVFAMANPVPEISYEEAMSTRPDVIMGTGRSDYPNQINNLLGFPYIFRGALDVKATAINDQMKIAASKAIAALAKEPVPEEVNIAYDVHNLKFGRNYILPKATDPRLITTIAPAVAKAAMDSGVARQPIEDWDKYREELVKRMGRANPVKRQMENSCKREPKRVLMTSADHYNMLKAAEIVSHEKLAVPVLLGDKQKIKHIISENELALKNVEIIDIKSEGEKERSQEYAQELFEKRFRKGMTPGEAKDKLKLMPYYSAMLVEHGVADALLSGLTRTYPSAIRPALQVIGKRKGVNVVSGTYIVLTKNGPLFLSDCTVNKNPTAQQLVEITLQTVSVVKSFKIEPHVALLSYSNFGSVADENVQKIKEAVGTLHAQYPDLVVDGEIQANVALNQEMMKESFPLSILAGKKVNTLIFPNLEAANIAYKLLHEVSKYEVIGPILNGMNKPAHVLQMGSSVNEIVNMIMISVMDAQVTDNSHNK
jgi:malate dehydrogenase (oxaloacetate-decarboxylating)(NADP+)